MKTVLTEDENGIIDEVGGSNVVVFEDNDTCAWVGVLCDICRDESNI